MYYYCNVYVAPETRKLAGVFSEKTAFLHFGLSQLYYMKKVIGIGGIFFKCRNPEKGKKWYSENLGLNINEYGAVFEWKHSEDDKTNSYIQWSPFEENTDYFDPSPKEFMINYCVENIEKLVEKLKKDGINVLDEIATYEYGKFVHLLDPENNKIELWEPVKNKIDKPDLNK